MKSVSKTALTGISLTKGNLRLTTYLISRKYALNMIKT